MHASAPIVSSLPISIESLIFSFKILFMFDTLTGKSMASGADIVKLFSWSLPSKIYANILYLHEPTRNMRGNLEVTNFFHINVQSVT